MTRRLGGLLVVLAACGGEGSDGSTTASAGGSTGGPATTAEAPTSGGAAATTSTTSGGEAGATSTGEAFGEPFTITALDGQWLTGTGGWDTQHRDVEVDLGEGSYAQVLLTIDLESSCYPFEKWDADPPPPGQSWPAKCDAFDRTMGFIFDPAAGEADPPGFEALRSITPFGGPQHAEQDITHWANMHPGVHSLRSYINSWPDGAGQVSGSEGGWTLSVKIDVVPGPPPRPVVAAIPLFQGEVGADLGQTALAFTLPESATKTELVYTISGHGGASDPSADCIGPAEEFCKRTHHLFVDDAELMAFEPWRTDCADFCTVMQHVWPDDTSFNYCAENPCGSIPSVNAPRAWWCPGDVVKPIRGPLAIGAGEHSFGFLVDGLYPGGTWTTSVVIYAFAE